MADGITIEFESKDVERLLSKILFKVKKPARLMRQLQRYVNAVTRQMFRGRRPDNGGVRGQKWAKLKKSTIEQKAALRKKGRAIQIHRPLVRTGRMRDSLRVLRKQLKGFVYGTGVRKKGFPYPGIHQVGSEKTNLPARKWLFLTRKDLRQMIKMATDHIRGRLRGHNKYVIK